MTLSLFACARRSWRDPAGGTGNTNSKLEGRHWRPATLWPAWVPADIILSKRYDGGSRDPTEWHGAEDRAEADGQDRQAWRQTAQNWSLMQLVIDEERVIKVDGAALQGLRGLHRPGSGAAPACRAHPPAALAHARRALAPIPAG